MIRITEAHEHRKASGVGASTPVWFRVRFPDESSRLIEGRAEPHLIQTVAGKNDAVSAWALRRIHMECELKQILPSEDLANYVLDLDEPSAVLIAETTQVPECRYRDASGPDWMCRAGVDSEARKTNPRGCGECQMPDRAILCDWLCHVTRTSQKSAFHTPKVLEGQCGSLEAKHNAGGPTPHLCRPGGYVCWTQQVTDSSDGPGRTWSGPEVLREFDYLNSAWRTSIGAGRLIGAGALHPVAGLCERVVSLSDLLGRLNDLSSILDRLKVADDAMPTSGNRSAWQSAKSLARIEIVLEDKGLSAAPAKTLRSIHGLHISLKHEPGSALHKMRELGLPVTDGWPEVWRAVLSQVGDALALIEADLRTLETD